MMGKLKLQWKLFAFLAFFCGVLVLALWLMQTVFLRDMYQFVRKTEINKAIAWVEQNIDNPSLPQILYALQMDNDILVTPTIDFIPPTKPENKGRPPEETITVEKTFTLSNGEAKSLVFHAMISPVEATISTLRLQLYMVTGMMALLSVALALVIARRIAKPIEIINESAKNLASGKYDIRFSGDGYREIRELSDTLNTTATELSKVESLRRELMANVSHDLRTPLALIYSYAEMMHDFPAEITPDQTQIIMDETKRLTSLVSDMLDISRIETGEIKLMAREYCLTDSLQATVNRVYELVKKDGYDLSFEYDEDVFVVADESKITQAFYNLLINAIIHGGANKRVMIRQTIDNNAVKVEVVDHGEGIPPDSLPYIWDRYYKVDKTHMRPVTGTGLGLSIVRKLIDLHGGAYGAESGIDNGSVFWFSLKL